MATYKVVIIGAPGVGKTSILVRYMFNEFKQPFSRVIGEERKDVTTNGETITLELWDTAEQERYASITQHFYDNVSGIIIVYDVSDFESFQQATQFWYREVMTYLNHYNMIHTPIILVGNKRDLKEKVVDLREAKEFSRKFHLLPPIECSAKSGEKVGRLFTVIAQEILKTGHDNSLKEKHLPLVSESRTKSSCC